MSSKVIDVPDGLFGSKTLSVIYFFNPMIKSWSMRITLSSLTPIRKARRILTSSKMIDVPDGLFGSKTLSVIYFWNPQIKSWSMMISPVIFDSNQEG